jgi:peptidyl-prolyl cis-trans isomerase D
MGMMTKMRDNAHVFIIAFAVVFVAFWVISDVDISSVMRGSQSEIGNIGGRSISYQEFQAMVDQLSEQKRKQNNGKDLDEATINSVREQVWNDFVTQAIVERAVKDFGITVTDEEINDWIRSDNPPEQLTQYFKDSTGTFNKDAYLQFLNAGGGAENQKALVQIEKQLRSDLTRLKLTNLLSASVIISDQSLRSLYKDQNIQVDLNYVFFDPRVIAAKDTGKPTQQELETFYSKNKELFKVEDMRKLKYVLFRDVPSSADTLATKNELNALIESAQKGTDFLTIVKESSDQQYQDKFVTVDQFPTQVVDSLLTKPVGSMVGPISSETGTSIYKIIDAQAGKETVSKAYHILFKTDGGQNEEQQKIKALDVLKKAKAGQNFNELAKKYSEEPGAAERGGELPWFGKGRMVKEFEAAVEKAKIGEIVGPVKTNFGFHIIKVTGKTAKELKIAELRIPVRASSRTRDDLYDKARNFAYFAQDHGIEQEAKLNKYNIDETPEFSKQGGSYIPNLGANASLMKFAFEAKVGAISEVHRTPQGYVVAQVSAKRSAGYKSVQEVRDQISSQVVYERQLTKTLAYANSIANGIRSLSDLTAKNPGLTMTNSTPFNLGAGPAMIGRDEAIIGALLNMKQGQLSKPIRAMRGIYVFQILSMSPFDETAYRVKRDELRQQNLQQLQNEFMQSWIEGMKEKISITDNRDRFFK